MINGHAHVPVGVGDFNTACEELSRAANKFKKVHTCVYGDKTITWIVDTNYITIIAPAAMGDELLQRLSTERVG